MDKKNHKTTQTGLEIAVIGMAGRFPGAVNIEEFRENLENGVESVTFYIDDELKAAGIDADLLKNPGYVRSGGGVLDDADCFDASFFGYLPGEAEIMDPQCRVFHECAWEALEDAGYNPNAYNGTIGVYAGATNNPAWEIAVLMSGKDKAVGEFNALTLTNKEFLCLWVSYKLNLKGPAVEINTTCSTSLVAIHTACRALWTRECDIALAGGVSIRSTPASGYLYREGIIISPDGHCRAFDAAAAGTITGDGAGVVVLKKLKEAVTHGDNIYAVVKGTAVNNDGIRRVGFTAPSIEGQADVIKTALHISRVEPETIGYIETHGTGTAIGDPIEIEALTLAFNTPEKNYCALGSVKTNIGHLDAAAGAAGFIKTVLALKYRRIPPSLHFKTPNPKIDFRNSPFFVNTEPREWKNKNEYPLRAGVSSFGIGGTNAHAVLEEWRENGTRETEDNRHCLLLLSGKTESALEKMTKNLADHFKKTPGIHLADAAYTLALGREAFEYRKTVGCSGLNDAVHALESSDPDKVQVFQCKEKKRPVVFMFPGQGSQYVDMGRDLYDTEPLFREEMDRCFKLLEPLMENNPKAILYPSPRGGDNRSNGSYRTHKTYSKEIDRTEITQPLIVAFEYALARLLMAWGISPSAMIGHSIGEYTAACLSGVFSLENALKLTALRGRLMQSMPPGAMLSVSLPEDQLKPLIDPGLSLAAVNSTSLSVISGPHEAVEKFESRLKEMGHTTRRLHTSHAFHSAMMEPILPEFEKRVKKIPLDKPAIPFISGVTGHWISKKKAADPGYWTGHLRETVNFRDGLSRLLEIKDALFIEVGPGNVSSAFLKQHKDKQADHFVINLVRHPGEKTPDHAYLLSKIGQLWLYGAKIDWEGFYSPGKRHRISLPTYPFEGRKFLFTAGTALNGSKIRARSTVTPEQGEEAFTGEEDRGNGGKESVISYSRPELTRPYAAPGTRIEKKLVHLWQDFFGIQPIGIDDDFFELGGDSLKAATITARIHRELRVAVPLAEMFNHSTLRELSRYVRGAEKTGYQRIEAVEKKEYYPLSPAQKRLYILHRFEEKNTAYNSTDILSLEGTIHKDTLEKTFKQLIARHESLRTSFDIINGEPVQRVHDHGEFTIDYFTPKDTGESEDPGQFIRPFDLSRAPLMRVGLIKKEEKKHILVMDMHHIITDGTSLEITVRDFISFYSRRELPPLKLRYKDYSQWRQSPGVQKTLAAQEEYWRMEFADRVPVLNLPADFPRPPVQRFEGNTVRFKVNSEETKRLNEIAHTGEATLFMVILAVYNIFLAKLCGGEDIVVGTPLAGRGHADLENIVGMFVNTAALYGSPFGEKPFERFLTEMKEKVLDAFENQDYPFEDLVEKIALKRDMSRNPLFDTMFVLEKFIDVDGSGRITTRKTGGLKIKPYPCEHHTSKFDLTLEANELDHELYFSMEYSTALFKQETITRFIGYFKNILSAVTRAPGEKISGIEFITAGEKKQVLFDFNDTETEFPGDKTIHRLFEEQVERVPGHTAAAAPPLHVTYRELNERSHRMAAVLNEKGARADTIVGIMVHRSVEMIVGIIGILKAGGAFLPIDPHYPEERIIYMLKDSNAKVLVTNVSEGSFFDRLNCQLSIVNCRLLMSSTKATHHSSNPFITHHSDNLAYVIYTSGTTGKPKGTGVEHRSLVNLCTWHHRYYRVTEKDIATQYAGIGFDASVWEIFPYLTAGAVLYIIDSNIRVDIDALNRYFEKNCVTISFLPTPVCHQFMKLANTSLRRLLTGGDALRDFKKGNYELYNNYGPTENTVVTTAYPVTRHQENIPIGRPVFNTRVYILPVSRGPGDYSQPQPVGVPGELCIAGESLARGYLNRPELTAEKIDQDFQDLQDDQDEKGPASREHYIEKGKGIDKNPLTSLPLYPSTPLYRTGDLARWLPGGNIEFLGRMDHQVKIRGYRVELGEIENRLLTCRDIDEAAAVTRDNKTGEKVLCAYFSSKKKTDISELRRALALMLPPYMIPSHFIQVEKIPLTHSGKIDRKALESYAIRTGTGVDYTQPQNEIEKKIAETWKDVLGLEKVGVNENFFDLGGTSLDIIKLSAAFRDIFNEEETVVQVFRYPTIRSFAEHLSRQGDETAADPGVPPPLPVNRIKQLRQNQKNKRIKGGISNA